MGPIDTCASYAGECGQLPHTSLSDRRLVEQLLIRQAIDMGLMPPHPLPLQQQLPTATAGFEAAETGIARADVMTASEEVTLPFSGIFAVGDNPRADVRGANAALHP